MSCDALIVGGTAHVSGTFYDHDGNLVDPSNVDFYWYTPTAGSTVITGTYSQVDPELVNPSTGVYYVDLNTTEEGTWHYRWEGSGTWNAAMEGTFVVGASSFVGRSTGP